MDFVTLGKQLLETSAFVTLGLIIFGLAFWLMEVVTPFSIRKEMEEKQNIAIAIVLSAVVIGISLVIMGALKG